MDLSRRPVDLAHALQAAGADVVVVGGTARLLRGAAWRPRDLDVVVSPDAVPGLLAALDSSGPLRGPRRFDTSYGPVDVFPGDAPAWTHVEGLRVAVLRVASC